MSDWPTDAMIYAARKAVEDHDFPNGVGVSLDVAPGAMADGLVAAFDAAPQVLVYEPEHDNVLVWACKDVLDGWYVAMREECETQECQNEHRMLVAGPKVSP